MIGLLDLANPDELIVRTNATYGHLLDSGHLDERPLASLSADATPALVEALPLIAEPERAEVQRRLLKKHAAPVADWRTFNLSRWQAAAALAPLR